MGSIDRESSLAVLLAVVGGEAEKTSVGRGAEGSRWSVELEEIKKIGRSRASDNFETDAAALVFNSLFYRQPV